MSAPDARTAGDGGQCGLNVRVEVDCVWSPAAAVQLHAVDGVPAARADGGSGVPGGAGAGPVGRRAGAARARRAPRARTHLLLRLAAR